jgi:peroxiredoxin
VDYAVLLARAALSALFLVAGIAKLMDRSGSRTAMAGFGLPATLASPLGVVLPVVELLVAGALIPASTARWGALGALLLLALFIAGIANVMLRGREAECHCFGQLHSSRVGWPTLARNVALALSAAFVFAREGAASSPSVAASLGGLSTTTLLVAGAGAVALTLLVGMAWFMAQLLRQHGRILLRLDTLEEQLAAQGLIVGRARDATPDGLDIGAVAPSFALDDLNGGVTTLRDLLAPALPVMLVFAHPGCTPCAAMLSEIAKWQAAHADTLTIAVLSEGSAELNTASVATHGHRRVLLQTGRETADAYAAYGTPSAIVVSSEGLIASAVAQGAAEMRVLLGTVVAMPASNGNGASRAHAGENADAPSWRDDALPEMSRMGVDAS